MFCPTGFRWTRADSEKLTEWGRDTCFFFFFLAHIAHPVNSASDGSGNSRITSVTFPEITANSITLAWTAASSATKYNIFYTTDGNVFSRVPPPAGSRTQPWPSALQP